MMLPWLSKERRRKDSLSKHWLLGAMDKLDNQCFKLKKLAISFESTVCLLEDAGLASHLRCLRKFPYGITPFRKEWACWLSLNTVIIIGSPFEGNSTPVFLHHCIRSCFICSTLRVWQPSCRVCCYWPGCDISQHSSSFFAPVSCGTTGTLFFRPWRDWSTRTTTTCLCLSDQPVISLWHGCIRWFNCCRLYSLDSINYLLLGSNFFCF